MKKKEYQNFFLFVRSYYFQSKILGAAALLTTRTLLANTWNNLWPERIIGFRDIKNEEEFSDCHISLEEAVIHELTEHARSENALTIKESNINIWLSIEENK